MGSHDLGDPLHEPLKEASFGNFPIYIYQTSLHSNSFQPPLHTIQYLFSPFDIGLFTSHRLRKASLFFNKPPSSSIAGSTWKITRNMTSIYAQRRTLSVQTRESFRRSRSEDARIDERLHFYLSYLREVVPAGITVHHIPANRGNASTQHNGQLTETREEIQLLTHTGRIFMSGLVSMENEYRPLETVSGYEAYTKWLDGDFARDRDNWRFFTGHNSLRFFNSYHGDKWERMATYFPAQYVQQVADYLQQEFDRLEGY